MSSALHSEAVFSQLKIQPLISTLEYGPFLLTGQSNSEKGRSEKVKMGIISETKFLITISPVANVIKLFMDVIMPLHNTLERLSQASLSSLV